MTTDDPRTYYDAEYASVYDADWQESPAWSAEAQHHLETLGELVEPHTRWLDVGCGTGWFLSQFPGVPRAGLDYSGAMLERARDANPDALFFREADARVDVPEWRDRWDLVTCTGQPYGYFRTMDEIEALADNLASWTHPSGRCLLTVSDLLDLTGTEPNYHFGESLVPDEGYSVDGTIWSYQDSTGTVHREMIFASLHVWVRWFSRWFRTIDINHWPMDLPQLNAPRRFLVMTDKRGPDDTAPADIRFHAPAGADVQTPPPTGAGEAGAIEQSPPDGRSSPSDAEVGEGGRPPLDGLSSGVLARELLSRASASGERSLQRAARRTRRFAKRE